MTKLQVLLHIYKAYRSRSDKSIKGNIDDILNTKLRDIQLPGTFKTELLQAGWKVGKVDRDQTLKEFGQHMHRATEGYKTNLAPIYKWGQMNPVLHKLLQAKKHSDKSNYTQKTEIVRNLLIERPNEFYIDSRQSATVGLTHRPTGFKIHLRKGALPFEFLEKENKPKEKVAYMMQARGIRALVGGLMRTPAKTFITKDPMHFTNKVVDSAKFMPANHLSQVKDHLHGAATFSGPFSGFATKLPLNAERTKSLGSAFIGVPERKITAHELWHARSPIFPKSENAAYFYGGWKAPRNGTFMDRLKSGFSEWKRYHTPQVQAIYR